MKGSLGFLKYGCSFSSPVSLSQVFRLTFKMNLNLSQRRRGGAEEKGGAPRKGKS